MHTSCTLQNMLRRNLDELKRGPMTEDELAVMRTIGDRLYGRR